MWFNCAKRFHATVVKKQGGYSINWDGAEGTPEEHALYLYDQVNLFLERCAAHEAKQKREFLALAPIENTLAIKKKELDPLS